MATNDGGPAFPCRVVEHEDGCFVDVDYTGVSIRDYMAAKAMQGMLANHEFNMTHAEYATEAYRHADAMLAAREAKP